MLQRQHMSAFAEPSLTLSAVRDGIISCERCPRLRSYCQTVGAREARGVSRRDLLGAAGAGLRRSRGPRPDPRAGAGGARRESHRPRVHRRRRRRVGRLPDGGAAPRRASRTSRRRNASDDGLALRDVYIAAAVRCAPPENKPLPEEIATLPAAPRRRVAHLPRLQVVVALGKIAWDAWLQLLGRAPARCRARVRRSAMAPDRLAGRRAGISAPNGPAPRIRTR